MMSVCVLDAYAQGAETNTAVTVSVKKNFTDSFSAMAYVEDRVYDFFSSQKYFICGGEVAYRFLPWLKAEGGYYYFAVSKKSADTETLHTPAYINSRHRFVVGLSGDIKLGKVVLSVRERYQATNNPQYSVTSYDKSDGTEIHTPAGGSTEHLLRSRVQAKYKIPNTRLTPFASVEFLNYLDKGMDLSNVRYMIGAEYAFSKHSAVSLSYTFRDYMESRNIHMYTASYNIKF